VRKARHDPVPLDVLAAACVSFRLQMGVFDDVVQMPLNIVDHPAAPECGGKQWSVVDEDQLADLCALVLVGRARHVRSILNGTQKHAAIASAELKAQLQAQLIVESNTAIWHRDGLLFEIITWIVACKSAAPTDAVSDPHLRSTQQGIDTIRISFDDQGKSVTRAIIHEQKCTDNARDEFRDNVIPAFRAWIEGKRDNQLAQVTMGLLDRFNLTDEQRVQIYDKLLQERPLAFQASLTVAPSPYQQAKCVKLFKGYSELTPNIHDRLGDTFPLAEIRPWFAEFAQRVWDNIEAMDV